MDCYEQVEESWKEVFKKSNSDTIEQLFGAVKDLYGAKPKNQYCHLGKSPVILEDSCDQKFPILIWSFSKESAILFMTSKNEMMNSPINKFKLLHKGQRASLNPFLMA